MRRLSEIAPAVLVATSERYVTTTTVVTGNAGGCLVIDPALTVPQVAALAAELAAARLAPQAGFATHPHWDHVLWCTGLGDVPRYAAPGAAAAAIAGRDELISEMRASAPGHDLGLFGRLTALAPGAIRSAITAPGWTGWPRFPASGRSSLVTGPSATPRSSAAG